MIRVNSIERFGHLAQAGHGHTAVQMDFHRQVLIDLQSLLCGIVSKRETADSHAVEITQLIRCTQRDRVIEQEAVFLICGTFLIRNGSRIHIAVQSSFGGSEFEIRDQPVFCSENFGGRTAAFRDNDGKRRLEQLRRTDTLYRIGILHHQMLHGFSVNLNGTGLILGELNIDDNFRIGR